MCIILFYQIFNTNKILNYQASLIQIKNLNNEKLKDSIKNLNDISETNNYFSLKGNAILNSSDKFNFNEQLLIKQLFEMNSKGELYKFLDIHQGIFLIDHIKIINQKWILIGFQSDLSWGQAILEFKKNKTKNNFNFQKLKSFVLPL